jgi:hypothetical protein
MPEVAWGDWPQGGRQEIAIWKVSGVLSICLSLFSTDLGHNLTVINIYGPHHDRHIYWNSLAKCEWFKDNDFLLGRDLNFSPGASEVWGPRVAQYPLNNFFLNYLDQAGLVDVEPQKVTPTWCNRWVGPDQVAKRLDKFLLIEDLLESSNLVR